MLGGAGWTRKSVEKFLSAPVYTIPCGSVCKGDDPHGRIIHDYSYACREASIINTSLLENSLKYIAFKERVRALDQIS